MNTNGYCWGTVDSADQQPVSENPESNFRNLVYLNSDTE